MSRRPAPRSRPAAAEVQAAEAALYAAYQALRERLFTALLAAAPRAEARPGLALDLTQRLLDRLIAQLLCEDTDRASPAGSCAALDAIAASSGYAPEGVEAWALLKPYLQATRPLPPDLEAARVPNWVLCGPGVSWLSLARGLRVGEGAGALAPEALGRVFERGLADLERMQAEAEGRAALPTRKRDGVYYTPEPIAAYLVAEAIGAQLRGARPSGAPSREALLAYARRLRSLRVLDPACGAGIFLVQALRCLVDERVWVAEALAREGGPPGPVDREALARAALSENLYGVDVQPAAVALTRLTLSLAAQGHGRAPPALEAHTRCGDALIDTEVAAQLPEVERAALRPFDWAEAFPEVFAGEDPGFDVVLGNPPYVKLQHLREAHPAQANALSAARRPDGAPRYESTQTGNFDLYLPFIERGLELLRRGGCLAYIAPSLWLSSDYGRGLRGLVRRGRSLARWVDFGSHQVFPDAVTYTALQRFRGAPGPDPLLLRAPDGELSGLSWDRDAAPVPWESLSETAPWRLLPPVERQLWETLSARCRPLGERAHIAVGVQTSADSVYHLRRVGPGRYTPKRSQEVVALEEGALRPLLSGPEADRYVAPASDKVLLFPYAVEGGEATLLSAAEMAERFPLAWAYLRAHEATLRARERGKMDREDAWWGYNYPKNLALQHLPKLAVAQTVPCMRVAFDVTGQHCLNNVRVNGIFCADAAEAWYLLGVLNAPVADYVFKRTAKPKAGGYFEANKQYIAPLPIPEADDDAHSEVASLAEALQALHTQRAGLVAQMQRRPRRTAASPERGATQRPQLELVEAGIAAGEAALNRRVYALYGLSTEEITVVEAG